MRTDRSRLVSEASRSRRALEKFKVGGGRVFGAEDIIKAKTVCSVTGRDSTDVRTTKRLLKDGEVRLKAGENVIEVTVANLLVNALNEREHVRIAWDYPPDSGYSSKQIEYDKSFQASGLFGPIVLKAIVR